ncbi:MAG: hypothetical protein ABIH22_02975 [Candidatus Margulisiibacteriota bacterium]
MKINLFNKIIALGIVILVFPMQIASQAADQTYPRIDISGYKTFEYRNITVDPQSNYAAGATALGGVFPSMATGPWQEKLQLTTLAEMNEDLSIIYNIEQQPLVPDRYDVKVNYKDEHMLTFGDFTASFTGNEFATVTKRLDGMMYLGKRPNYDIVFVPAAKSMSQLQSRQEQSGNNTHGPYSLGHGFILEGSERIELNNVLQARGKDYTIDYFEGKIYFNRILNKTDTFAYSYEYSNVTDLYFPAVSRNDFFGLQGRFNLDPYNWGREEIPPRSKTGYATQTFPTQSSQVLSQEIPEKEAAGIYTLDYAPVKIFSESVTFQGRKLEKYQDYKINYDKGEITLLLPVLVSDADPMVVTYSYYETGVESDNIAGDGSRGPYDLSHTDVVIGSEIITVDGNPVSNLEYALDYKNGKITFDYNISNTSNIIVNYRYVLFEAPPIKEPAKAPYQLIIGGTYLKETAKKGVKESTEEYVERFAGSTITGNNDLIYLDYFPMVSTSEGGTLVIKKDGVTLTPGVDYVVPSTGKFPYINDPADSSDGYYTGTIKILATLEATSEVTVLYTYNKNIVGRFTDAGNGSRGPYYILDYHNIVPGTEKVEVWETDSPFRKSYSRNTSFESDAGDFGYSINYDKDQPYLTFNKELDSSQKYTIYFQYVPPAMTTGSNLQRDVTGFDIDFKLGDDGLLGIKGDFAASRSDQVQAALSTYESYTGFDPSVSPPSVQLAHAPVIENSERISVNNHLINKDEDYLINYTSGKIIFYSIALSAQDIVVVEYNYPDPAGLPSGTSKSDSAHDLEITSKLGDLSLAYGQREIGFDFYPLGSTPQGVGSIHKDHSVSFSPNFHKLQLAYSYREQNNPLQPAKGSSFNRNFERDYSFSIAPYNIIELGFSREEKESGPASNASASPTIEADQKITSANFTLLPIKRGIFSWNLSGDLRKTAQNNLANSTTSNIDYDHLNSTFYFTSRVKVGLDRKVSDSSDKTLNVGTARSKTEDLAYDLNLNLTYGTLKKWDLYAKLIDHLQATYLPAVSSEITKNMTLHMNLIPIDQITTSIDYNRQEKPSITVLGKNPLDEKFSSKVSLLPFENLPLDWQHSENQSILESGNENKGQSNAYSAIWTIISTENLSLTSSYKSYSTFSQSLSGTIESKTQINSFTQNYGLSYKPIEMLTIRPSYSQEDYQSEITSAGLLKTKMANPKINLTLDPFYWIGFNAYYDLKITTRLSDNVDKHKRNIGFATTLRPFDWGTIVYNTGYEHNGGEVSASGTLTESNYKKYTNDLALNFNFPQKHPLLETIILSFTYKHLKHRNLLSGREGENFDASSVVFEGVLNF